MDKLTRAVQAFYETFPYPTGLSEQDEQTDPANLLVDLPQGPAGKGPWQVLEAGCGCGAGLISAAIRHPQIQFTGIDINRVGIAQARARVEAERLSNIHFLTIDLMTLEGLQPPATGYDLIYSFGVLHHLSDPVLGLTHIAGLLAPKGVIAAMVVGRYGREPLRRLAEAIDLANDSNEPLEKKMLLARQLARIADDTLFTRTPWAGTADCDDIEFADRCLHVNEMSFDIDALWSLQTQAGLEFDRWLRPDDWSIGSLTEDGETRSRLEQLDEKTRYKLIERMCYRPKFEWLMRHAHSSQETLL